MLALLTVYRGRDDADAQQVTELVDRVRMRLGLSNDQMAREQGLSPQQWEQQRGGVGHISLFRLWKLGLKFRIAFCLEVLRGEGFAIFGPGELSETLTAVRTRMLKVRLRADGKKVSAA